MALWFMFFLLRALSNNTARTAPLTAETHYPYLLRDMKRASSDAISPALALDFPDPAFLQTDGEWYAFSTSSRGINVPVAQSTDFKRWSRLDTDAMPLLPDWVSQDRPAVWAPNVIKNDDGVYVMYFSAAHKDAPERHCIGLALSLGVTGPYFPVHGPLICPDPTGNGQDFSPAIRSEGRGGAIDAAGFQDTDGSRYIVWKVDGNSLRPGGRCGNNGPDKMPTPLMMVRVAGNGYQAIGTPRIILNRSERDGPLIEAPSLAKLADGAYVLLYSSNCFNSPHYDISYAASDNIWGPYKRRPGSMLKTGQAGLKAPGGASVSYNGARMLFHADFPGGRAMFATSLAGDMDKLALTMQR